MRRDRLRLDRGLVTKPPRDAKCLRSSGGGHVNGMRGHTNGMVSGTGRADGLTNGLTNGLGRTNGLTNGVRGKTSGVGYVNGLRLRRNQAGIVYPSDMRRSAVILAASVVFMLVASYLLGTPAPVPSPYQIDGKFAEWAGVPQYPDPTDAIPAPADLVAFAVHLEAGDVLVYAKVRGTLFADSEPSILFVFIDDPSLQGYHVAGMDAAFIVELWGWNSTLQGSQFWEWSGGSDRDNASALRGEGGVSAASAGSEIEMRIPARLLPVSSIDSLRFEVSTWSAGWTDSGMIVRGLPGAVVVTQRPVTDSISAPSAAVELRFRAHVADVVVRNLTVDHAGGGIVALPSFPFTVPAGQERVAYVGLDPTGMNPGDLATLHVTAVDAVAVNGTQPVPATIGGPTTRVYCGAVPTGFRIDGLFSEWTNTTPDPNDGLPSSIDILASASALPGDGFFYVRTEGELLAGAVLPKTPGKPVPSQGNGTPSPPGPPKPVPRTAAEDVLRVFVDVDDRDAVGYPIGGIYADRLLEVLGRNERITSRTLYAWDAGSGTWVSDPGAPDVALEGTQLEARMPASFLGATYGPRVVFETTDWSGASDLAYLAAMPVPTLQAVGVQPLHGTGAQSIEATLLSNDPVVDGVCLTTPTEYAGAQVFVGRNLTLYVGRRDASQFLYLCIAATADVTVNKWDMARIAFDRAHNGGAAPQTDDIRFRLDQTQYVLVEGGTGTGWSFKGVVYDPGDLMLNSFVGGFEQYEFKLRYADVWGTNSPAPGAVAGFAIAVLNNDAGYTWYYWGSSAVNENVPDSWGHLVYPIPEFPVPVAAVSTVALVLWYRRHRRLESR